MSSARRKISVKPPRGDLDADRATAVVVDENLGAVSSGSVRVSIVSDLAQRLGARQPLHGDVIDALVELVVELLDEESAHGEGQDR